ncbi:MAG: branched-chain amino acid ABC transporter permease [Pirellulales bacterium]|nr:branched-chain amino acid ABC transporter permease [Pirellulales bacterium]
MKPLRHWLPWTLGVFALLPIPISALSWDVFGDTLSLLFVYAILALALNVVVGYAGNLHLGIAAFFAIGVYVTAILCAQSYPFQIGVFPSLLAALCAAGLVGLMVGAPTLRLRGDYLALVTLGFGEVIKDTLMNWSAITNGSQGISGVVTPQFPAWLADWITQRGGNPDWATNYLWFYYFLLACLALVLWLLGNLESSRLGRAWVALREDELAAQCMGLNVTRLKLAAFAIASALAGFAGGLYVMKIQNTANPESYGFNLSIEILMCVILGGLGSRRGVLLGVLLVKGFDLILLPALSQQIAANSEWLKPDNYKLMIYGMALVLMMQFRPAGIFPEERIAHELQDPPPAAA